MFFQYCSFSDSRGLARFGGAAILLPLAALALLSANGCASSGASAASRNAQGVEYFSAGQYDKAIAMFEDSIEENPESAETYYNLGSALQRKANETGDFKMLAQAEDAYWTALETNPAPETIVCCYRGIATASTARGDSDNAMRALEEWRDRNPDSIEPKLEIAYLLEAQERDDDAYEALREVAELAPNDYRAYYKMGELSERAGDLDDASQQTSIAANLNRSNVEISRRARSLESQLAAQRRELEEDEDDEEEESALASDETPRSRTTRVESTSASAEEESVPALTLPPEEEKPQPPAAPSQEDSVPISAAPKLGFGEVVVLSNGGSDPAPSSSLDSTRVAQTSEPSGATWAKPDADDSDVKWISATNSPGTVAQASATSPKNVPAAETSAPAPLKAAPRPAEAPTSQTSASEPATAKPALPAPAPSRANKSETKRRKNRTDMGAGFPNIRAGSFF